jgi:hypothetical protein
MSADPEFSNWRTEWQAHTEIAAGRSAEVRRDALKQQRRLRASHLLELLSGVLFLVASAGFAWRVPSVEVFLWAAVVWLATLTVSAFSVWNWSSLWQHDLKSVAEFSQVYETRCLAKIRAARFGKWFVAVQAMIAVPWLTWDYHRGDFSTARLVGAMLLMILFCTGFWVWFSHSRGSASRELNRLRTIRNAP